MVVTILEARVSDENRAALEAAYQAAAEHKEAGLVESFLVHSTKEADLWRIITVWSSRQALEEMRSSGETPRGVLIFRSARAEPALSVFEVAHHIAPE